MPPAFLLPGCLLVCERTGRWAVALRRALPGIVLRETRTPAECREELGRAPASVVAVELAPGRIDETASFVSEVAASYPSALVVVVADRGLSPQEWLFRELGAAAWTDSPRALMGVSEAARRHLESTAAPAPGVREQILARLPWGDA